MSVDTTTFALKYLKKYFEFPILRYFLQQDPALTRRVQKLLLQIIESELMKNSPGAKAAARFGAVSFIQRFGRAGNAMSTVCRQARSALSMP